MFLGLRNLKLNFWATNLKSLLGAVNKIQGIANNNPTIPTLKHGGGSIMLLVCLLHFFSWNLGLNHNEKREGNSK